ncbi:MAG: LCP family protein [Desulfitobacteriia bacterium]|jgi:LCP family protein required for cell wall assembly
MLHAKGQKPKKEPRHKPRNLFLTIILALLPILIISGIAFSAYLSRPPELPPQDQGRQEEVTDVTPDNSLTEGDKGTAGTTEETTEGKGETAEGTTDQTDEEKPAKPPKQYKENFYTFVLTGTDYDGYHTDTIMVASFDTAANKVNIVSVPRDSQVDVPGDYKKINVAYANGGTKELKRQLESILGFAPQYSVRVDLEAFPKLVDAVGGVEFDVPQDMDMDDGTQNLHIHLQKGLQLLDGDKALQLVRFRGYPSADLGRMQIQQKFLKELAKRILSPANIPKIGTFIEIFSQSVKTDIGLRDLQWFAQQAIKLNPETDITVQTLPHLADGYYRGQNYLFLSPEGVVDMVNSTVNPYTTDISVEDVNIVRIEDSPPGEGENEKLTEREILKYSSRMFLLGSAVSTPNPHGLQIFVTAYFTSAY